MEENRQQLTMFFLLGMPSWALVNGTWAALASLAENVPEGYDISAYLILSLTFGNVLPFYLGQKSYLYSKRELARVMYLIQFVGFVAGMLMAWLWDVTETIGSHSLNIPLFLLFFVIGACSASTSVTYFTYVSKYSPLCTTYLSTGMGAGSFLAGLVALLQANLLPDAKYLTLLFAVVSCMFIPAGIALFLLEREDIDAGTMQLISDSFDITHRFKDTESSDEPTEQTPLHSSAPSSPQKYCKSPLKKDDDLINDLFNSDSIEHYKEEDVNTRNLQKFEEWNFVRANVVLLTFIGLASFLGHGLVPTIISSIAGKFENSALTLSFTTGEAAMLDPIFRFYTAYFRFETMQQIQYATYILIALALCMVFLAITPASKFALFEDDLGGLVIVTLHILFVTLFVFTNTSSFLYFKANVAEKSIGYAYKWSGLCVQIGAVIGSLISVFFFMMGLL